MLRDILAPGLDVIFCGVAVGDRSAGAGHYYAHPTNRFWRVLAEIGLTPRRLLPEEDGLLPDFGIGLTDVAKGVSGPDASIPEDRFDPGRLHRIVEDWRPRFLAFNGKKAAMAGAGLRRSPPYGPLPLPDRFPTEVRVLPSTSGAASRYWDLEPWAELGRSVVASRAIH